MPTYNSVFAAIHVEGKPLNEYQVQENDAQKEVSCWIPAQVGKEFTISYKNSSLDKHMSLKVLVDGYQAVGIYVPPKRQGTVSAFEISATQERPFLFSQGKLVDDDNLQGDMHNLDNLGAITISFQQVYVKTTNKNSSQVPFGPAIPDQRQIPERGKKGIQTCVALGPVQTRPLRRRIEVTYTNNVTRMVFRYRPLDYLQAQGIAPPPSSPQPQSTSPIPPVVATANKAKRKRADNTKSQAGPPETKRTKTEHEKLEDVEISDDADIEKLQALRARIDKALAKKNVRVKKEIKTEQVTALLEGEVIDLT